MSKNYMADIAKMLGVELGEKFKLVCSTNKNKLEGTYAICEGSFWRADTEDNQQDRTFAMILNGSYLVKKMPWKPIYGKHYFIPYISAGKADCDEKEWINLKCDEARYDAGMVCKTAQEAIEKAERMLAALRGRTENGNRNQSNERQAY